MLKGPDLSAAYASADIFMMPSETETLGFVALEAMASGLPVVAVAAGGLTDIITQPGITSERPPHLLAHVCAAFDTTFGTCLVWWSEAVLSRLSICPVTARDLTGMSNALLQHEQNMAKQTAIGFGEAETPRVCFKTPCNCVCLGVLAVPGCHL